MSNDVNSSIGIYRKQSLHATIIRACTHCGAPGYWHNTPGVNVGCYAPDKVTTLGCDPVGAVCPNCGTERSSPEDLGEIWSKLFGVTLGQHVRAKLRSLFK